MWSGLRTALILLIAFLTLNCSTDGFSMPGQDSEQAYFMFDCPPEPETFVILLTDPDLISQARAMLTGQEPPLHIMGQIIKQPAAYNPPWSYHLDPKTIEFFHAAIEICDATIVAVEVNLDEACGAFLPNCYWCPWSSRLVAEVHRLYLPFIIR